jgi:hypothetical protein
MKRLRKFFVQAVAASLVVLAACRVAAGETDNFSLPLDIELADLGPYLETAHTIALEQTVAEVNARIEKAILSKDETVRAARLTPLHDPLVLSKTFLKLFGYPLFEDKQLEHAVGGAWGSQMYAGHETVHPGMWMNFSAHAPLDLRRWLVLSQSKTIKASGVCFGTDKIVHFHHLGAAYYWRYLSLRREGMDEEEACHNVVQHFAKTGFWSERFMFGTTTTGIYSNADLAANYAGFKFFLNFTEPVLLRGEQRNPLLARSGVFWRLNHQVRPRSGWLKPFISDHWNEALNPNRYDCLMRGGIRRVLQSRAQGIVQFYTEMDGRPADPAYFDQLAQELSTYYGEPYGHSGAVDSLLTIGNTCLPALVVPGADARLSH